MKRSKIAEPTDTTQIVYACDAGILRERFTPPDVDVAESCQQYANGLASALSYVFPDATIEVLVDDQIATRTTSARTWTLVDGDLVEDTSTAAKHTLRRVETAADVVLQDLEWLRVRPDAARSIFEQAILGLGLPAIGTLEASQYDGGFPGEDSRKAIDAAWVQAKRGDRMQCLAELREIPVELKTFTVAQVATRLGTLPERKPCAACDSENDTSVAEEIRRMSAHLLALASIAASPAARAVTFLLNRIQLDADLGWLISPLTESFHQLCAAEAEERGETVEAAIARRSSAHYRFPRSLFKMGEQPAANDASEIDLTGLSAQGLVELRGRISQTLVDRAGKPIRLDEDGLWTGAEPPVGGRLLHVEQSTTEASYVDWYPTLSAAQAGLLQIADAAQRQLADDGFSVDLTQNGYSPTKAWIGPETEDVPTVKVCSSCGNVIEAPQLIGPELCATCADP